MNAPRSGTVGSNPVKRSGGFVAENQPAARQLQDFLHAGLEAIPRFERCALLDYPLHPNVGDHLIWIASLLYIERINGTKVSYTAPMNDFSLEAMKGAIGDGPIIFPGGGNLGDLWPSHQRLREWVIASCHDRPIYILPQTVHFISEMALNRAARIFNAHPDITVFVRDRKSYDLCQRWFHQCKILLAPDMVFHLSDLQLPLYSEFNRDSKLFLCRTDSELNQEFGSIDGVVEGLITQEWFAFGEVGFRKAWNWPTWLWQIPGASTVLGGFWRRRPESTEERRSRQEWLSIHPQSSTLDLEDERTLRSWGYVHDAICQLNRFPLVISNRLHGHIMSILLGIPNVLLPDSYGKNEQFFDTWTQDVPFTQYIERAEQIVEALCLVTDAPKTSSTKNLMSNLGIKGGNDASR